MKHIIIIVCIIIVSLQQCSAQSNLDKILKGGEILLGGLTIYKTLKSDATATNANALESLCIKNKLTDKIVLRLTGVEDKTSDIKKEIVIPTDGKECILQLPKGIYLYEFALANKEIYKKGEFLFDDPTTMTLKQE